MLELGDQLSIRGASPIRRANALKASNPVCLLPTIGIYPETRRGPEATQPASDTFCFSILSRASAPQPMPLALTNRKSKR